MGNLDFSRAQYVVRQNVNKKLFEIPLNLLYIINYKYCLED